MAKNSHLIQRKNWFENHPQYLAIKAHGYDKHNPFTSRSAMLVFLELCESKHWFGVEIHFSDKLKRVYLSGKPRKKAEKEIIVPLSVNTSLTVEEIQNIVTEIQRCVRDVPGYRSSNLAVTLGICDSDSSIVYYKVYNGLVEPNPPNADDGDHDDEDIFGIQTENK